jgi:cytochrome c oxidase subunit 2
LIGGAIVLGLLVAAYEFGYHRGQHHTAAVVATTPTQATSASASPSRAAGNLGPVTVSVALVARGKTLYTANGCSACHSLSGAAGVGPTLKGLAGSQVTLSDGSTVTASDAYLGQSISSPDAQIVKGYNAGIMPPAIASYNLNSKPADIRALVAFIKSQK